MKMKSCDRLVGKKKKDSKRLHLNSWMNAVSFDEIEVSGVGVVWGWEGNKGLYVDMFKFGSSSYSLVDRAHS